MSVYRENEKSGTFHNNAFNIKEFILACNNDENLQEKFKYLFHILYAKTIIDSFQAEDYEGIVYLKLTCSFVSVSELFEIGTKIFLNGIGYANILYVDRTLLASNTVSYIIDLDYNLTFQNIPDSFYLVIPHSINPTPGYLGNTDIYNHGYINIAQDLRTKVNPRFLPGYLPYRANETIFNYNIAYGYESKYVYNFLDNAFVGGNVAFVNNTLTALDLLDIPFKIGDEIKIQQDLYEWVYTDNTFAGTLAFTNSNPLIVHNFLPGQQVFVTNQITEPAYNGYVSVNVGSLTNTSTLVTDKPFTTSTPTEGGSIFGVPRPEYNTTTTIQDIYYDAILGVVILTNLPFTSSTQPIGGTIVYADSTYKNKQIKVENKVGLDIPQTRQTSLSYFNSEIFPISTETDYLYYINIPIRDEKYASLFPQVLDNNGLINGTAIYKCDMSAISYIYIKGHFNAYDSPDFIYKYIIYDDALNVIDTIDAPILFNELNKAWYMPISYNQVFTLANELGTPLTGLNPAYVELNILWYDDDVNDYVNAMHPVMTEIDKECSKGYPGIGDFDIIDGNYYIIFRDCMGSYLSIPCFNKSYESKETTTSTYYKNHRYIEDEYKVDSDVSVDSGRTYPTDIPYAKGRTNLYKRSNNKLKLNTAFLTDEEVRLVNDMIDSPEIYIQKGSFTLDETEVALVFSAQLLNTEFQTIKRNNGDLAQYTFDFSMSLDNLKF